MSLRTFTAAAAATLLLAVSASIVSAEDLSVGSLTIADPWVRAAPPNAPTAGGFLVVTNNGDTADRLVAASSPISETMQIHSMEMKDGVMVMRALRAGLEIPPGETVTLAPGGFHIMFIGLKQSPKEGDTVPVTLTFANAGDLGVDFPVQPIGAKTAPMAHDRGDAGGDMDDGAMDSDMHGDMDGDMQ